MKKKNLGIFQTTFLRKDIYLSVSSRNINYTLIIGWYESRCSYKWQECWLGQDTGLNYLCTFLSEPEFKWKEKYFKFVDSLPF